MLPTTKDHPINGVVPETDASMNGAGSTGSGQMPRRTDAIGAEIPVMVHASRYSSAGFGVGKNLPPVHEETRTVIVFPDGAVVRISASIAAGELVVLTNQLTGADVICRVANVKTQPGIQNYVNLEFTQRAPGFWDANNSLNGNKNVETAASAPAVAEPPTAAVETVEIKPPAPVPQVIAPKPILAAPSPVATPVSLETSNASATPAAPAAPVVKAQPAFSSAPAPAVTTPERRPSAAVMSSSLVGSGAGSSANSKSFSPAGDTAQVQSWARLNDLGAGKSSESSGTKKNLIIAAAAVLLLSVGAVGGGLLYSHRSASVASQASTKASEQTVPLPPVTTDQDAAATSSSSPRSSASAEAESLQPAVVASSASGQPDVPAAEPAAVKSASGAPSRIPSEQTNAQSRVAAATDTARHPSIAMDRLSAPVKPRIAGDSVEAAPLIVTTGTGLIDSGGLGGDLSGGANLEATRANNPTAGTPRVGGQIQAPRLISSPAPFYPTVARNQRVQGTVVIDATIDVTGKVIATKVISGPDQLQKAAADAVRSWKYQAGRLDGLAIVTHTQVSLAFHLP